jgi:hypothetical protein
MDRACPGGLIHSLSRSTDCEIVKGVAVEVAGSE